MIDELGDAIYANTLRPRASRLKAFDLDDFECADHELAAGALVSAAAIMVDQLFDDLQVLGSIHIPIRRDHLGQGRQATVLDMEERGEAIWLLDELPPRFAKHYTVGFVRRFVLAAGQVQMRLSADNEQVSPACLAEELALRLILRQARECYRQATGDPNADPYEGIEEAAFEDLDHEWLYMPELDGIENDATVTATMGNADMRIEAWFQPFTDRRVHPYTIDDAPPAEDH